MGAEVENDEKFAYETIHLRGNGDNTSIRVVCSALLDSCSIGCRSLFFLYIIHSQEMCTPFFLLPYWAVIHLLKASSNHPPLRHKRVFKINISGMRYKPQQHSARRAPTDRAAKDFRIQLIDKTLNLKSDSWKPTSSCRLDCNYIHRPLKALVEAPPMGQSYRQNMRSA